MSRLSTQNFYGADPIPEKRQGESVHLWALFEDENGVPMDPDSVRLRYVEGNSGTRVLLLSDALTNPESGLWEFHLEIPEDNDKAGVWFYRFEGQTGSETTVVFGRFSVGHEDFWDGVPT